MKTLLVFFRNSISDWRKDLTKHGTEWHALDNLLWGTAPYCPKTEVAVCRDNYGFHIAMRSYEQQIRYEAKERNGEVYEDSCMEFFFSPCPEEGLGYIHIEINARGTMLIGCSLTGMRQDARRVDAPDNTFFQLEVMPANPADYVGPYWMLQVLCSLHMDSRIFSLFPARTAKYSWKFLQMWR